MNELLSYYDRIEHENKILNSDDFSSQKLVIIGKAKKGEVLSPYLITDEKEAALIFGESEITKAFKEAKDAGSKIIYLMRIDYNSKLQKKRQLNQAYEVLETTPVDVILLANTSLDENHYNYPEVRDYINVGFGVNAVKDGKSISSKFFNNISISTDDKISKLTNKKIKDYFENFYVAQKDYFDYRNKNEFFDLIDENLSYDYEIIKDQIYPKKYKTYKGFTDRINDPEGFRPKAVIFSKSFKNQNNLISKIKINIEGFYNKWRDYESVEIYYYNGKKYVKILNNQETILEKELRETKFKIVLNNKNFINPPIVNSIDIEITYSSDNYYDYFNIENNHPYIKIWTKDDGSDYVYSSFNKIKYVSENTFREYLIVDLAKACQRLGCIGIVKGPILNDNEDYDEYIQRAKNIIDTIKNELQNDELRKYVGVVFSDGFINGNGGIYDNSLEAAYAGLFTSIPSNISPTNKDIENVLYLKNVFKKKDLEELSELGYTVIVKTVRNGIVPLKSVSLVQEESSFLALNNTRIGNESIKKINEVTDEYIGIGLINFKEEDIRNDISKKLEDMIDENKITDFKISFSRIKPSEVEITIDVYVDDEVFSVYITG
jgi:hypothetical protein